MTNDSYYIAPNDWQNMIFRLCLALVVGGIIGSERELKQKPAGLRTHMLVCVGSAMFVLIPLQMGIHSSSPDALSRVIQGVAAGIGFIGAGEILRPSAQTNSSKTVQGLTSAAAIWVSAALGVAAGCGLWRLGLTGAFVSLLILNIFKKIENM
ncbi:MAG: MgtC/SapB family protein [Nostocaceae cyanobacterium]|nr:MgtC/SapB family protein [Nostocaceae cyanobacterium]